ncbi:MAG: hypothetical protein ABW224_04085 [Kibdelosporangium sp.]
MRIVVAGVVLVLLAGCSSTVAGSASEGTGVQTTTGTTTRPPTTSTTSSRTTAPTTTGTTTNSPVAAPPTSIDPATNQQYCERTITGALGKQMEVVVVETPAGRVNCDQAGAVLVDYYSQRRDPQPGSVPLEVAGFACNQVPEPDIPQVICTDGDSLIYSMWRQGG